MHRLRRHLARALLASTLVATGCGAADDPSTAASGADSSGNITVSAAASLTLPFTQIGEDFEAEHPEAGRVRFNFDSSSTLVNQIHDGAPADAFASADEANMTELTGAGLVLGDPTVFARNKMAIVVKKDNPAGITGLADLARVDILSLCAHEAPCGRYADQILDTAGVTIPTGRVTRGQNVKTAVAAVSEGDADAAIVYVTDVTDAVDLVEIPDAQNLFATYPIAVLASSPNPEAAQAFVDFVLSPGGQATLHDAGFLPPE